MEAAPPSYEAAVRSDYLDLVTQYISSTDLCRFAVVCSRWHLAAARRLWGHPASHFGVENDRVYVALTRFKRTLRTARLLVRSMTHTLHLPPAHAELYEGPRAEWLREILQRLPSLQSLIVRGLPFFDHSALRALAYRPAEPAKDTPSPAAIELPGSEVPLPRLTVGTLPAFNLRLLDASRCPNLTTSGLVDALPRFENLLYLDLSFTYAARDPNVIQSLHSLAGLQVIKLRGINLTDDGLRVLATTVRRRVRSLDIRDNQITDRGVRTLLIHCFQESDMHSHTPQSPALLTYLGSEMLNVYQGEDFEGYLRSTFTRNFVSRLAIEDVPIGGLTHLYIAGNAITVEGASGLVRSGRLHVLDLAECLTTIALHSDPSVLPSVGIPSEEKLLNVLSRHAAKTLTFLRIGHGLVTKETQSMAAGDGPSKHVELADTSVVISTIAEADSTRVFTAVHEMPENTTPRAELQGDDPYFSPRSDQDADHIAAKVEQLDIRRGSVFAPEVVDASTSAVPHTDGPPTPPVYEREQKPSLLLPTRVLQSHSFHPAMLPRLKVLVLTNVPPSSPDKTVSDRVIRLIEYCAAEQWRANQQARVDYCAPPGRMGQQSALKTSASNIFALTKVVLEIAPVQTAAAGTKGRSWQRSSTKSMTEDRDSETLWKAAETDFSFFDDDEECGLPSLEARTSTPLTNEKIVAGGGPPSPVAKAKANTFDTVAIIGEFRRARRDAHARACREAGTTEIFTQGCWEGLVQVIRPINNLRKDEEQDYYGNIFTGGYLYR